MTGRISDADIAAAKAFGSATLYEASKLDCAFDPGLRPAWSGAVMAGRAYTARCHPCDNLAIHHAMERIQPGDALVVDCGGILAGYWGEVLAESALARSVTGLVIDGGVRDVPQMAELGFAAFSRGICIKRTAKHSQGLIDMPMTIAGVLVAPGDLIVADTDGIVAIPVANIGEVLEASAARVAKEEKIIAELREGATTMQAYALPARVTS